MMSIEKNEQTPRSVSILALGDTMWFMAAIWIGLWIGTGLRNGEFDYGMIHMAVVSCIFGYAINLIGGIYEKLENAGF
jgi:hypothetical protein